MQCASGLPLMRSAQACEVVRAERPQRRPRGQGAQPRLRAWYARSALTHWGLQLSSSCARSQRVASVARGSGLSGMEGAARARTSAFMSTGSDMAPAAEGGEAAVSSADVERMKGFRCGSARSCTPADQRGRSRHANTLHRMQGAGSGCWAAGRGAHACTPPRTCENRPRIRN